MSAILFIDTETIPEDLPLWDGLALDKPPANYKKPEAIEKWRQANAGNAWRRLAVNPRRNRVIVAAWRWRINGRDFPTETGNANQLLCEIGKDWDRLVAHNAPFDVWSLVSHGIRMGHDGARNLTTQLVAKPWERRIVDTCRALKIDGDRYGPSLHAACEWLGVETPKADLDGSQVLDAWLSGDYGRARVRHYCARDVDALVKVYDIAHAWGLL